MAAILCMLVIMQAAAAGGETYRPAPGEFADVLKIVNPGDTVLLSEGVYPGGAWLTRSGAEGAPITIRGVSGKTVFEGGEDGLRIEGANWIVVEGIRFQNAAVAGIRVRMGSLPYAEHITVRDCVFADNGGWGVLTSHIRHFHIEDCEAYGSVKEHGIYVANSSHYAVVRNNRVHHNYGHGIHVNGDPGCGGDGVIRGALVEGNRIYENGRLGGAAISIMHVQDSVFRGNVIYNNHSNGIWFWANGCGVDRYSSRDNQVLDNTIYFRPGEGRFALLVHRTVTGTTILDNILVGGQRAAVYIEPWIIDSVTADRNVYAAHPGQRLIGDSSGGQGAGNSTTRPYAPDPFAEFADLGFEVNTTNEGDIDVTVESWRAFGLDPNSVFGAMPRFADPEAGDFRLVDPVKP